MLEYDLLYGSETRPILSVGFFFHRTWDCPGDEVEPHTDWSPLGVQFYFFFWASPSLPTPPPPLHHHPHPGMFKGLLTTMRYTSSVSEHLYRSHTPPPHPPHPGMFKGLLTTMRYTSTISSFNMGCLFIIRWKKVLSQSHTRSTDDLLLPVRDAQWSVFIFDSSPSLGPRVKSK